MFCENYDIVQKIVGKLKLLPDLIAGLATKSYVEEEVTGLATESYVDGKVEGLASESYVDGKVEGLASESYVDGKLGKQILEIHTQTVQFTSDGQEVTFTYDKTYTTTPKVLAIANTGTGSRDNVPIITEYYPQEGQVTLKLYSLGGGTPNGSPSIRIFVIEP